MGYKGRQIYPEQLYKPHKEEWASFWTGEHVKHFMLKQHNPISKFYAQTLWLLNEGIIGEEADGKHGEQLRGHWYNSGKNARKALCKAVAIQASLWTTWRKKFTELFCELMGC